MNYKIVTVSNRFPTSWYFLYREFFQTIKDYNSILIDYSQTDVWKGLATKPKWLYRAIKEGYIKEEYMIFSDCWDLVFCATPEEILERYQSFGSDIVISAERNCFPSDHKEEYDKLDTKTPYKYLNSGFIVGKTDAILTCLEAMNLQTVRDDYWDNESGQAVHSNDQLLWQSIFLQQPVSIALDQYQSLSQTLHDVTIDEFDFSKRRIRNVITNSTPCSFHFNGGAKDGALREPILAHLNL